MRALSKSKILAYRQCPKRLWLEINQPALRIESAFTIASFNSGHAVGDMARRIYDPDNKGVLIDPKREGFDSAFARTARLLTSQQPIFEAALTTSGALALADVMLPANERGRIEWRMIEVKSATSVKDYHLEDAAIQGYIANQSGANVKEIAIACIDSGWVYPGGGAYLGLLNETDVTEEVSSRAAEVKRWIKESQNILATDKAPDVAIGDHCIQPFRCGFYEHCSKDQPPAERPISWLPNVRTKALKSHIEEQGIVEIQDVPDDLLNELQLRVKQCSLSGEVYFDSQGAAADLSAYTAPAYFLDFETTTFAVPLWQGTRPYQQIPFQYSLHRLARNGQLTHTEFLDLSGDDPSALFATALIKDCGKQGPIYVYNAGFETARVRELAVRYPEFETALLAINARIVDLLPIARQRYYHPSQHGSWSIKKVLPAIAPDLCYESLDGVQDGGMAMEAFAEAIGDTCDDERKAEIEKQLLRYCELDTLAMVRMWYFFSSPATMP